MLRANEMTYVCACFTVVCVKTILRLQSSYSFAKSTCLDILKIPATYVTVRVTYSYFIL